MAAALVAALVLTALAAAQTTRPAGERATTKPVAKPAVAKPVAKPAVTTVYARRLHLPAGVKATMPYALTDSTGVRWDIQPTGAIGRSPTYAFSQSNTLQIQNRNFGVSSNHTRLSADRREVELGPAVFDGITVHRRVRVYKDQPICRWLEIFENPTTSPRKIQVHLYTLIMYSISRTVGRSGNRALGQDDWAFITVNQYQGTRKIPQVLSVVGDGKGKVKAAVQAQSSRLSIRQTLTIPPRGAVVLCHFQSLGTEKDLTARMKAWKFGPLMKDLPWSVRQLTVNMRSGRYDEEPPTVDRTIAADRIELDNGDVVMGRLLNPGYAFKTSWGELTVPAEQVIGLVTREKDHRQALLVLRDGQVVSGVPIEGVLRLALPTGGTLQIPTHRIRQCGYKITPAKPSDVVTTGPLVALRTGDRLAFHPDGMTMTLDTDHGRISLSPDGLQGIRVNLPETYIDQVLFRNGSRLSGILDPTVRKYRLRLGPTIELEREQIRGLIWTGELTDSAEMSEVRLRNGDELIGHLPGKVLTLNSEFGTVQVKPANVQSIRAEPGADSRLVMELWDGSILRGTLAGETLPFVIGPDGPEVAINVAKIELLRRPGALPPKELLAKIETLIGQLGSEVFEDRQKATAELIRIGKPAMPSLKRRLADPDLEIRQRAKDILGKINQSPVSGSPPPPRARHIHNGQVILQIGPGNQVIQVGQ